MGATLATMNDALNRITDQTLHEQIFQGNEFLDKLQKQTQYKAGEEYRVVLHTGRNGGTTMLPDGGGNLNAAGNQGINKAAYNYKHMHQQIAIQEDALEGTASDAQSVANVLDVEVTGALNDMRKQITRQLFGNGDSIIATCGTTTTTNVVTLGVDGYNAIVRGWLFPGLPVDIGTAASQASLVSGETIASVNELAATTSTITVTTSISTTSSNFVSLKGARSGTTAYEINGLRNIVSTSATLGGLSTTTQPLWKAASVDTTAQPLSLTLILQAAQKINQKDGGDADTILMGLKQERKFYELLQQQVNYSSDSSIDAGNSKKATWAGKRPMVHPDCPDEDLYVLKLEHLFMMSSRKPFWQNAQTGGKILDWIQGTASYGAKLGYHFNLGTDRRNSFARLGGLT